jgi:hypothetical protein
MISRASLVVALASVGCAGGSPGPAPVTTCGSEQRAQLSCESEFKYDARKMEGGFSALGVGSVQAKTEETALRQIDVETERYVASMRRLCDEYNKCVLDRETYATRSENLRRRLAKLPELYDAVKQAPSEPDRRRVLQAAYHELVPDEQRTELRLDLAVMARKPGEEAPRAIGPGAALPTDTKLSFVVATSRAAHLYVFQKGASGATNVLFPDDRIAVKNPIPAGAPLRIPGGSAAFRLNDKDVGTERVFIVASLSPLASLDQVVASLAAGKDGGATFGALAKAAPSSAKGCTRALELDTGGDGCVRDRGLELDTGGAGEKPLLPEASMRATSEAADSVIARVFSFEHTKLPGFDDYLLRSHSGSADVVADGAGSPVGFGGRCAGALHAATAPIARASTSVATPALTACLPRSAAAFRQRWGSARRSRPDRARSRRSRAKGPASGSPRSPS